MAKSHFVDVPPPSPPSELSYKIGLCMRAATEDDLGTYCTAQARQQTTHSGAGPRLPINVPQTGFVLLNLLLSKFVPVLCTFSYFSRTTQDKTRNNSNKSAERLSLSLCRSVMLRVSLAIALRRAPPSNNARTAAAAFATSSNSSSNRIRNSACSSIIVFQQRMTLNVVPCPEQTSLFVIDLDKLNH